MPMRELWLLRHAKSAWDTDAPSDFERPLNRRGERDAPRMGRWMRRQGWIPDRVLASPARRARQTAEAVCRELGIDPGAICWEPRLYEASVSDLLAVLRSCPETARRVLVVGHNPGLEELALTLCGPLALPGKKLLPTAALLRLAVSGDWADLGPGKGRLLERVRPRDLPEDL